MIKLERGLQLVSTETKRGFIIVEVGPTTVEYLDIYPGEAIPRISSVIGFELDLASGALRAVGKAREVTNG